VQQRWITDWDVKKTDINNNGGMVKFVFDFNKYWNGASPVIAGAASQYVLLKRSTSNGTFDTLAVSSKAVVGNKVIFTLNASAINTFFTIGTMNLNLSPLPVELTRFGCRKTSDNQVQLTWSTASEDNNDYFTVERSADAKNYVAIAKVKGGGNSYVPLHYSSMDNSPLLGTSFYRIKQTDFNGMSKYSKACVVNNLKSQEVGDVMIYPNPTNAIINIDLGETVARKIIIISSHGEVVYSTNASEQNKLKVDMSAFADGIYMVQIQTADSRMINRKVIIQK
jgi:hypothetical protein